MFRVVNKVKDVGLDDHTITKCWKAVKVIVGLFLALGVLTCAVVSKATLLLVSSNMYVNVTLLCRRLPSQARGAYCSGAAQETTEVPKPSSSVDIRWVWAMFGLVVTPYILTFIKCLWTICFKKCRNPKWTTFLVVGIPDN